MKNKEMEQHFGDSTNEKKITAKTDKEEKPKRDHDETCNSKEKQPKCEKKTSKHWGSIGKVLNEMFCEGDKIEVFNGTDQIDKVGSFIAATDNYLIWANSHGDVNLQNIGGALSIRKTGAKNKSSSKKKTDNKKHHNSPEDKKSDHKKQHNSPEGKKNEYKNELVVLKNTDEGNQKNLMEAILSDMEALKSDAQLTLETSLNKDDTITLS